VIKILPSWLTGMVLLVVLLLSGCATTPAGYNYSEYRQARPLSILVLPPFNSSVDAAASYGMLSQVTYPLAESGYYVLPVALTAETFKQNGLNNPADAYALPIEKLREIFGADAAVYINVKEYGTSYKVIASYTNVIAQAKLVDLRSGKLLWEGEALASNQEGQGSQGSVVGALVSALINQIVSNLTDQITPLTALAANRLLAAGQPNGMLYGPRSPLYQKD
jgi:hypothetical protein